FFIGRSKIERKKKEAPKVEGFFPTRPSECWCSIDLYTHENALYTQVFSWCREGLENWFLRGPQGTSFGGGDSPSSKWCTTGGSPLSCKKSKDEGKGALFRPGFDRCFAFP